MVCVALTHTRAEKATFARGIHSARAPFTATGDWTARASVVFQNTREQQSTACSPARSAARTAARSAARSAAHTVSHSAAHSAARTAARGAAARGTAARGTAAHSAARARSAAEVLPARQPMLLLPSLPPSTPPRASQPPWTCSGGRSYRALLASTT